MRKYFFVLLPLLLGLVGAGCLSKNNPQNNPTPTTTPPVATTTTVKVALILLEDDGKQGKKIGCNDSVVMVPRSISASAQPVNSAYQELFAVKSMRNTEPGFTNELYHALYPVINRTNGLVFDNAIIENDTAKIYLTGSFGNIGGACDEPRIEAQLEETAKQFAGVQKVEFFLNGQSTNLKDVLK